MNIALLSPAQNAYSETFIGEHKKNLSGKIFHYYSGELPTKLEGGLVINSRKKRIVNIIKGHYGLNNFSLEEQALINSFKLNKIDLIFAEYGLTGEKIMPVAKKLQLPIIVHFHGHDATIIENLKKVEYYKNLFFFASYIVVVSKKMYADFLKWGCPKEKLIYNVYGPRNEFLQISAKFTKCQFIAIGRFVDKKAPYYLILSFLEVIKIYPDAILVIAGNGELWNSCRNLIKFFNLEKNVILPGVIDATQFQKYLEESLAFVQHSIKAANGDEEGTPLAVLEASAAGIPVISTRHAGIVDVVMDEESGLLSDEHDVLGMSKNMIKLIKNKNLAIEMGNRGKENILNNYSIKRHIDILDVLIHKAINEKHK